MSAGNAEREALFARAQRVQSYLGDAYRGEPADVIDQLVKLVRATLGQQGGGAVAEPIGYLNPRILGAQGKIDVSNALTWSSAPLGGWTMAIYAAPPAPQEAREPLTDGPTLLSTEDLKMRGWLSQLNWAVECLEKYGHVDDDEGDFTRDMQELALWLDARAVIAATAKGERG